MNKSLRIKWYLSVRRPVASQANRYTHAVNVSIISLTRKCGYRLGFRENAINPKCIHLLSCQPRVTLMSYFVDKC